MLGGVLKVTAEDNPQPPVDDYLALLVTLWRGGFSVNLNVARAELRVFPSPTVAMAEWIRKHYDELTHWLPGACDNCHAWSLQRIEAYWSAHTHLCPNCLSWAISIFDARGKWPEATWYEGETDFEEDDEQD